ncbi:MAG: hypothetical protein WD048_07935, partial [Chitinophagales bacterium]
SQNYINIFFVDIQPLIRITDEKGNKISVVLPIKTFKHILEELKSNEIVKISDDEEKNWLNFSKQQFAKLYENEEVNYDDEAI